MKELIQKHLKASMTYPEYRSVIDGLLANNKTTGSNHSEEYLHYTKMNVARMNRWDKKTEILPTVKEKIERIDRSQTWLIITEAWCGDAAQIVPVINQLASLNVKIEVKLVLRDENLKLMDAFLTNGGRSIPIVIVVDDETKAVVGTFGPRPAEMQKLVMARKNDPNASPYSEFVVEVQKWYAKDKAKSIQKEFTALF